MIKFLDIQKITQKYSEEINEAVIRVVNSGWYLQGEENKKFEAEYAAYTGSVVTRNIPPYTLWYGNPAKLKGYVTKQGTIVSVGLKDDTNNEYMLNRDGEPEKINHDKIS